jgi:selenium metabolism protein YedF
VIVGRVVDVRGLPCPRPVVETKKALQEVEEGAVTVLVDSAESRENVRRFAESQGCRVEVVEREGHFRLEIAKGESQEAARKLSGDVVLIESDCLGTGDRELGEILMKAFLNTLWDTEPKPAKVLLLNSAVNLVTEGSDVLDTLRLLEEEGVRILSCGTCLEYYGLKEQLRVGQVTNMYDTVSSLIAADKVIRI